VPVRLATTVVALAAMVGALATAYGLRIGGHPTAGSPASPIAGRGPIGGAEPATGLTRHDGR